MWCSQNRAFPVFKGGTCWPVVLHFSAVLSLPLPTGALAGKAPWGLSLSISLLTSLIEEGSEAHSLVPL